MTRREYALRYFDEQKSGMDARIRNGIETYRKGNAEIRFVSKSKLPESITVHAEQLRHAFQFGANLFMLDEFETEEKNGLYRGKFPEAFNLATLPGDICAQDGSQGPGAVNSCSHGIQC